MSGAELWRNVCADLHAGPRPLNAPLATDLCSMLPQCSVVRRLAIRLAARTASAGRSTCAYETRRRSNGAPEGCPPARRQWEARPHNSPPWPLHPPRR